MPTARSACSTLLVKCGLAASNGEARRLVQQGGVAMANDEKVTDHRRQATLRPTVGGDGVVLKKGKKVFHRVVLG